MVGTKLDLNHWSVSIFMDFPVLFKTSRYRRNTCCSRASSTAPTRFSQTIAQRLALLFTRTSLIMGTEQSTWQFILLHHVSSVPNISGVPGEVADTYGVVQLESALASGNDALSVLQLVLRQNNCAKSKKPEEFPSTERLARASEGSYDTTVIFLGVGERHILTRSTGICNAPDPLINFEAQDPDDHLQWPSQPCEVAAVVVDSAGQLAVGVRHSTPPARLGQIGCVPGTEIYADPEVAVVW